MTPFRSPADTWDSLWPTVGEAGLVNAHVPARFEVRFDGQLWQVLKDREPVAHHSERSEAIRGVRQAMQRLFATGKSAQWRLIAAND